MSQGPWEHKDAPRDEPAPSRRRLFMWLAVLAAGSLGLWLLFQAFPGVVDGGEDWVWVAWGVLWLVAASTRLLAEGPVRWREKAKHAALWVGIIAALAVGYSYRTELTGVVQRVRGEASGGYPVETAPRELVVTATDGGGFFVMGRVNGQVVRFLVDTGASDTVLSPADARRIGLDVAALTFDHEAETANGTGYGAAVTVESLAVGSIQFAEVPVLVNQAPMSYSLLGLTFLHRLESFQVKDGRLYLKARD